MRNHIDLIETLPINAINRAVARANYDAAEASIDRIVTGHPRAGGECGDVVATP